MFTRRAHLGRLKLDFAIVLLTSLASAAAGRSEAQDQLEQLVYDHPPTPRLLPKQEPSFAPLDAESDRFIHVREARSEFGVSGAGLAVVVVDTGVNQDHVSFQGQLLPGMNFSEKGAPENTLDLDGHGSNVAGIIGAKVLLNEDMPVGIAPGARIIPLKVFPGGQSSRIVDALQWTLDHQDRYLTEHGVLISAVNLSLGTRENITRGMGREAPDKAKQAELIGRLRSRGIVVTVSAGNHYFPFESKEGMSFPAICQDTVSVGAVFDDVYRARPGGVPWREYTDGSVVFSGLPSRCVAFSQRLGEHVGGASRTDLFAPGFIMTSMGPSTDREGQDKARTRTTQDGTSQAAPVTAGVALLLQESYMRMNMATGRSSSDLPSVDLIEECLRNGGVEFDDVEDAEAARMDNVSGCGARFVRLDALGALRYLRSRWEPNLVPDLRARQADLLANAKPSVEIAPRSTKIKLVMASTVKGVVEPARDLDRIENMIRRGAVASGIEPPIVSPLIGPFGRKALEDQIEKALADETTTLVCYLKLHGRIDKNREGAHIMELDFLDAAQPEQITRAEVRRILENQQARLTVLITESCSQSEIISAPIARAGGFPRELFEALFVNPSGFTDVNSSTYARNGQILDQAAWMDADGAVFTRMLVHAFDAGDQQDDILARIRREGSGAFTWPGFLSYLTAETTSEYRRLKTNQLVVIDRELSDPRTMLDRLQKSHSLRNGLDRQTDQFPQAYELAR
ncbi:S8 family peptidase [Paludisphaera soli]|uniref:S8 family peptidase n=1 Tax=Paludisphaera soli TaxID=2712865 RepID=UPI0013EA8522|nr:S8 family serine peptidase [Paludisphaera soli]